MNQSQHDELAHLFAQQMQVSQAAQQQRIEQIPFQSIVENVPQHSLEKQAEQQPVHFISSHYTGTTHVRPSDITSEPSQSPPPPYNETMMSEGMADILRQNSIDPSALLQNQIHLFQNADYEQRLRLLELWRIAPPSYPLEEHLKVGTWTPTSFEREQALAKMRYEDRIVEERHGARVRQEEHMLDTYIPEPISPIREAGEDAWPPAARMRASTISSRGNSRPETRHGEAEPYIVNGFAASTSSPRAVDTVYAAAAGLWAAPGYAHAIQQQNSVTEDQYGMYEQVRNHADWERMNEQIARAKLGQMQPQPVAEDYDMEL
ncbi:hypothetical protein LTR37_004845 [Vermiconidia calcicola]|uniref:Uncharacterized protein n=1 Tax=Vermiconidia calcicola TaxID=1690605 RepID=A0ACC3NMI6_9PEZI|nr:hypothetical protein LTR37_004845 [Vermiconidia calcicola]